MTTASAARKPAQIRVTRRSTAYWRVTIDNPPINVMGPEMVKQFQEVIGALEADGQVRVVVFDGAGVRSVGTSVAATVHRASMHPSMRRRQGTRSLPASNRARIGSTITRS